MTGKLEEDMKRLEEKLCDIVKKENVILNKDMSKEVRELKWYPKYR